MGLAEERREESKPAESLHYVSEDRSSAISFRPGLPRLVTGHARLPHSLRALNPFLPVPIPLAMLVLTSVAQGRGT